jgi:hypothetical protein
MSVPFNPERYKASIKTKRKNKNKTPFFTINSEGNKFMCVTAPVSGVENATVQQLMFDPLTIDSYKRFIHDRILDGDDEDFNKKLEAYGYDKCAVYTWILKSNDKEKPTLETMAIDTPVKLYMTKVVTAQEIGTTHFDLNVLHPRDSSEDMPVIGAGELRVLTPTKIEFNLLSGTYMASKILKGKSKLTQDLLQEQITILLRRKLGKKGFEVEPIGTTDLIEGACFTTPKETMNTLRSFFKNTTQKNKTNKKNKNNSSALGAGAGTAHSGKN